MNSWLVKLLWLAICTKCTVSVCTVGWVANDLYCYYFSENNATFEEAMGNCTKRESHLTDITNAVENNFIFSNTAQLHGKSYWIGYRLIIQGIWRWQASGLAGSFFKWDIGEPDGEGECTRLTPYNYGSWRDMPCDEHLPYVCKMFAQCSHPPLRANTTIQFYHSALELARNISYYPDQTEAFYTCIVGYEYPDGSLNKISTCELGGVWRTAKDEETECKPTKCFAPPEYDFATSNTTGNEYYTFGSVISYACYDGYWFSAYEAMVQYKYLTCQSDKQWRGDDVSHCSLMYCIRPVTPNAAANTSLNKLGTIASYHCNVGYVFEDGNKTKTFTCSEQTWQPLPELCIILSCPEYSVENALSSTNSVVYNTLVIWTCKEGMQYPDTSTQKAMRCLESQQWDFPIKVGCENKRCTGRPPNTTESITSNWNASHAYYYSDKLTYTCVYPGWTFPSQEPIPTREVMCGPEGDWVPLNIGECMGERIVVNTKHEEVEAKEVKNAPILGTVGYIFIGAILLCVLVLDFSTIGKHIAMMKANIFPQKEDKLQVAVKSDKTKRKAAKPSVNFREENEMIGL